MCLGMAGAGLSMIIQGIPDTLLPFAIMQFVGGLFFCGIHPAINAVLANNTPPSYKGRIFGMLFAAQQVGSMAGPLLGGLGLRLLRRPAALPELRHRAPLPRPARLLNQSAKAICLQSSGRILPPSCRTNKVFKPLYPGTQRMWPYEHTHCR